MTNLATISVSSLAAAVDARSVAYPRTGPSTWQACPTVTSADASTKATRVRMHDGNGFLITRRLKERSSP